MGRISPLTIVVVVALAASCKREAPIPTAAVSARPEPVASAAMPPKPTVSPEEEGLKKAADAESLSDAIAIALPFMVDVKNLDSPGAEMMAVWGSRHAKWGDFDQPVGKLETNYDKAQKDPDGARGKRSCINGRIVQIRTTKFGAGKGDAGLISAVGGRLVRFLSVGSSEGILEHSGAFFCGVVTGLYTYDNSGGGVGHAIEMVGFFKIPENTNPRKR